MNQKKGIKNHRTVEMNKAVGIRIQQRRIELHMTQKSLALKVGVETHYISRLECGNCNGSLALLDRISKTLGITLDYILNGNGNKCEDEILFEKIHRLNAQDRVEVTHLIDLILERHASEIDA